MSAGDGAGIELTVDRERCVGSGNCEFWAPGSFAVGADGIATVVGDPNAELAEVVLAAENCPTNAIVVLGP